MRKPSKDKPAVRPPKETCAKCECHGLCIAEDGVVNYVCPKMADAKR